ncbi:MOP flippase family protein [Pontibacter qinzhouensis]|uniref:MOP flippase family protein n=1 Tax=Pontibacter qinzhouensis TaxID=2603253 RepID=A0A5C8KDW9_9BACT|nr:MOP flippase family protein [Pontibacter qinzhouensis]TXK52121.1 MOP flippase family protein [Pontibacter qinzhouensis]
MSIKDKAIKGGKWITTSTAITTVLQFGQVAILARLLEPAAFGLVGICTMLIGFFSIFSNLGFSNSIISKQENDKKLLSTIYYLNLCLGGIIGVLVFFSSTLVAAYYNEPKLVNVIRLSSLSFVIIYFGQIYLFLLQKELRFKSVALIDIIGGVVGTTVAITLAYMGFEELSLIIGNLVMVSVKTLLQILFGIRLFFPVLHFKLNEIKDHIRFGIINVGDGVVGYVQGNADNFLVSSMLGVQALGYYTIALQLAVFPIQKLNPIILQIAYPVIAKFKEQPTELRNTYLKILDLISFVNFPLLVGLFLTVDGVVPLIYGEGWESTFPLIRIFVFVSMLSCLGHPLYTLVFTKDKPQLLFKLNIFILFVKIPLVFLLGNYWGVTGIACSYLIATIIHTIINFFIVNSLIGNFFKPFFLNISKIAMFCVSMVVLIYMYKSLVGFSGLYNTLVQIGIGGVTYLALTLIYKYSLSDLKNLKQSL